MKILTYKWRATLPRRDVVDLRHVLLRLPLHRLQHPKHVEGEFAKLDLLLASPDYNHFL